MAAVLEHEHAAVGEPLASPAGPAEQRRLGERLGLERRRRERGGLHDPGERRAPAGGIEKMVCGGAVASSQLRRPMPLVATPPSAQLEAVEHARVERARDLNRCAACRRPAGRRRSRPRRRWILELLGHRSANRPLAEPAAVDRHAGRACDDAVRRHHDLAPARERARDCRPCAAARAAAPHRAASGRSEVGRVAGGLDLAHERGVHEAAGRAGRVHHRLRRAAPSSRVTGTRGRGSLVQERELAGRLEAREAPCHSRSCRRASWGRARRCRACRRRSPAPRSASRSSRSGVSTRRSRLARLHRGRCAR